MLLRIGRFLNGEIDDGGVRLNIDEIKDWGDLFREWAYEDVLQKERMSTRIASYFRYNPQLASCDSICTYQS